MANAAVLFPIRVPTRSKKSASETGWMFFPQRVKMVAPAVELLNFVQDRIRRHGTPGADYAKLRTGDLNG
jgi:hypothetical protein